MFGVTDGRRCKHFERPIISFTVPKAQTADIPHYLEHEVLSEILQNARKQCYIPLPKSKSYQNEGTQTDYRESEAQTDPWEPPYKIVSGHNPEVLTLAHLTWKHGLPPGIHEMHVINRMRMKRAWETILPPMDTSTNIKIRSSIITALEIEEWAFRESEIQFIMDLRFKLMSKVLQKRDSEYKEKMRGRFQRLRDKLRIHQDRQVKAIRNSLKRDLRKLNRKHRDKQYPRKPDIIEQHSDPKSDLYAPQMRFGEHPQRRHEILQKQFSSESYIDQENTTLSWLPTIEELKITKDKFKPVDICIRETKWTEEKLKQLHSDLKAIRLNVKSMGAIPILMKHNYKQQLLPVTPCRSGVWDSKRKQLEESATFIQKIIKGRAIQYLMYERHDRCRELIKELQSTHALEKQSQQECDDERTYMVDLQRIQNDGLIQENRLSEILNSLEGKTICETLDILNKELIRLQDERRVHAFALLAERERYRREAAEANRRQLERNRRREFDEMFKQIVKINQDSVEIYLEDIIKEGVDWISDKAARKHVLELCDKMDNISKCTLENTNVMAEEELIADMIYDFVLPEVEKHKMRKNIKQDYIRDAHISICEKISNLPTIESSQVINQKIFIKNDDILCVYNMEQDTEEKVNAQDNERIGSKLDVQNVILTQESTEIIHSLLNSIIANVIESTGISTESS